MSKFYEQKGLVQQPSRARNVLLRTTSLLSYGLELELPSNDRHLYEITSFAVFLFHTAAAGNREPVVEVREPDGVTAVQRFSLGAIAPSILGYFFDTETEPGFVSVVAETSRFSMPDFIVPLNHRVFFYDFANIDGGDFIIRTLWAARLITSV